MSEHPPLSRHRLDAHHSLQSSHGRVDSSQALQAPLPADAPAYSGLNVSVYVTQETVTANAIGTVSVNVNVSGEESSGQPPRAFGFVHRVDHVADAGVWASTRQTPHYAKSCGVCLPPHAAL